MFNYWFLGTFATDKNRLYLALYGKKCTFVCFYRRNDSVVKVTSNGKLWCFLVNDMDRGDQDLYIGTKYSFIGPLF